MISIVICSRNPEALRNVSKSVAETIGTPYEIIPVDNSGGQYGICEAYNIGAQKSRGSILCFMHEDINFHTDEWGNIVNTILSDNTIGVLGVAGGTRQIAAPTGWGSGGREYVRMNVMHTIPGEETTLDNVNPNNDVLANVASVDGLWFCVRRPVWEEYKFDSQAFPDFHFYDVDFCTRIFPKYRICVTFNILIEHFSRGSYNDSWRKAAARFFRIRNSYLPFGPDIKEAEDEAKIALYSLQQFTPDFIDRDISFVESLYLVSQCIIKNNFNKHSWWILKMLLLKKIKLN